MKGCGFQCSETAFEISDTGRFKPDIDFMQCEFIDGKGKNIDRNKEVARHVENID